MIPTVQARCKADKLDPGSPWGVSQRASGSLRAGGVTRLTSQGSHSPDWPYSVRPWEPRAREKRS